MIDPSERAEATAWERVAVATVRGLAMDAPAAANSGHSGTAMALAPLAVALYGSVLRHDPDDPHWFDRDRFILSCGHASILQYSMLHLTGYDLSVDDLRAFRQLGSKTPGHPESLRTEGVEVTTGPLGQGLANSVGMAIAERFLRHTVGDHLVDHRIWVFASDGDLEEGVSHEAASLAGHLGLDHLCVVYDDNRITIDGEAEIAFSDDTAARFRAYGWEVRELGEAGDDVALLRDALQSAAAVRGAPTLLVLRTHIGTPSPTMVDRKEAHGAPFSSEEIEATKVRMGVPTSPAFYVPDGLLDWFSDSLAPMRAAHAAWEQRRAADPAGAALLDRLISATMAPGDAATRPSFAAGDAVATRKAVHALLQGAAARMPGLLAGAADLTENTGMLLKGEAANSKDSPAGRQVYYGIREFAMAASLTGMALHGGVVPVGATFFVFSDYMRPAIRLAALSQAPVRLVFSHDSIGVGEDGPTHQPIEHLFSLRCIPGLDVVRPADATECAMVFDAVLQAAGPVALVVSRQDLPVLATTSQPAFGTALDGAYVLADPEGAQVTLVGTGSEVHLCVEAAMGLAADGIEARVVSMPCWEWFDATSFDYQAAVLPEDLPVVSVEAGVTLGWERYADASVGIDEFGASAPGRAVFEHFGITAEHVAATVREVLGA